MTDGIDDEIEDIIDEDGGTKNEDGLTRLVTRLLMPFGSELPCRGIDIDDAGTARAGPCGTTDGEDTTMGAKEDEGAVAGE